MQNVEWKENTKLWRLDGCETVTQALVERIVRADPDAVVFQYIHKWRSMDAEKDRDTLESRPKREDDITVVEVSWRYLVRRVALLAQTLLQVSSQHWKDARLNEITLAVCCSGGIENLVPLIAAFFCGFPYLPLNLSDPRTKLMLQQFKQRLVVMSDADALPEDMIPEFEHKQGCSSLINLSRMFKSEAPSYPRALEFLKRLQTGVSTDVSHVFFSSGSTGIPKRIVATHSSLMCYLRGRLKLLLGRHRLSKRPKSRSKKLFLASFYTFDPHLGDTLTALLTGSILVGASREMITGGHLVQCLKLSCATHICLTPSLFSMSVAASVGSYSALPMLVPSLEEIMLGGEPMSIDLLQHARHWRNDDLRLVNTYGTTEGCIYQTEFLVNGCYQSLASEVATKGCEASCLRNVIGEAYHSLRVGLRFNSMPGLCTVFCEEWSLGLSATSGLAALCLSAQLCKESSLGGGRLLGDVNEVERKQLARIATVISMVEFLLAFRAVSFPCSLGWTSALCLLQFLQAEKKRAKKCALLLLQRSIVRSLWISASLLGMSIGHLLKISQVILSVPPGFTGEIIFSGAQARTWYASSEENPDVMLCTGDTGMFVSLVDLKTHSAFASIQYLGRTDSQVKINGVRMNLIEVEQTLERLSETIEKCFVFYCHTGTGSKKALVACVLFRCTESETEAPVDNQKANVSSLQTVVEKLFRLFCVINLPGYMNPRYFARLTLGPCVYATGDKVLRSRLQEMVEEHLMATEKTLVEPKELNEVERSVLDLCHQRLGGSLPISLSDSFQMLGGDSLTALRISTELLTKLFEKGLVATAVYERIRTYGEFELQGRQVDGSLLAFCIAPSRLLNAGSLYEFSRDIISALKSYSSVPESVRVMDVKPPSVARTNQSDAGTEVLNLVCKAGEVKWLETLLDKRHFGQTALRLKSLIKHTARSSQSGFSALHLAVLSTSIETVTLLLHHGANTYAPGPEGELPCHLAAAIPAPVGTLILKQLVPHMEAQRSVKNVVRVRDSRRQTLLHAAARGGNVNTLEFVMSLLDKKDRPELLKTLDRFHRTATHWAVMNNHPEVLTVLIRYGADIDQDIKGSVKTRSTYLPYETPRQLATRKNLFPILSVINSFHSETSTRPRARSQ